jgi:outer membrane cobalamin receptor
MAAPCCWRRTRACLAADTVVTATRTEQPLSDLVADVSIVDRETIERSGATGLADVLARLPGVEMSRNGGPGHATSLFLRGAESRFTAVYIDGVRMDSQSTGGARGSRFRWRRSTASKCCAARQARCTARTPWAA